MRAFADKLDAMRQRFVDRYQNRIDALVKLTEAQDPFSRRSRRTPTAIATSPRRRSSCRVPKTA